MLLSDLLDLFVDGDSQELKIYDLCEFVQEIVYEGKGSNIPDKYLDCEVCTIDNIGKYFGKDLVINIDSSDL